MFKTKNGRDVIDGRGIEPDVKIEPEEYSRLTAMLFRSNIIFHYATKFHVENERIQMLKIFIYLKNNMLNLKNMY